MTGPASTPGKGQTRIRLVYFLPALLFAGLAAVVAVYMLSGNDPRAIPSALIDKPAPQFSLPPLEGDGTGDGKGLATADLKGTVTVLNVFASWCGPCLIEHPQISKLGKLKGVRLVGLNYKNKPADARAWLEKHGNPYALIGADRDGRVAIEWGVYGVPETYVIDRRGRIRFRHVGPVTGQVLEEQIIPVIRRLVP